MKPETKARVALARTKLTHFDYRPLNAQGVCEKTLCKCCGAILTSLVATEQGSWTVKKGNQMIVYQPTCVMPTNEYAVLEISMEDGSCHQTPICKTCAAGELDLEAIYLADLHRLELTGQNVSEMEGKRPVKARAI